MPNLVQEHPKSGGKVMNRRAAVTPLVLVSLSLSLLVACGESRSERLKREAGYSEKKEKAPKVEIEEVPPHPTRDKLAPVLSAIYSQDKLPDVLDAEMEEANSYGYELSPGVMAVIRIEQGLSPQRQVRAIVTAVAEADAWAYRSKSRRPYAEQIQKVRVGYGDDQKVIILKAYADLKLMDFFNSEGAAAAIGALPADVKPIVEAMSKEYTTDKRAVWDRWMNVKMYARRVVAADEPFRTVLRTIKKEMGMEEPPPITWEEAQGEPAFAEWAKSIRDDEELIAKVINMRDLKDRERYFADTHTLFAMEGSERIPKRARKLKPDKDTGFAVMREDLGGGYNDLTFVFSKKLSGPKLKYAWFQAVVYGSLLSDFQLLATAGSDFAKRDELNRLDTSTSVVPDKYDPVFAECGSRAALDTFVVHYGNKYPILAGMSAKTKNEDKILEEAHACVIASCRPEIYIPSEDNDQDVEGAAPGSRLGLYQMLARFENVDVNMAKMAEERTEEDDVIDEASLILKRIKDKKNAHKGTK
jgi:hypothetical protein